MMTSCPEKSVAAGVTPLLLPGEIWKDIPGYVGQYQASSLGPIRSLDRYVQYRRGKTVYQVFYPGKLLKQSSTRTRPYLKVTLCHHRDFEVHSLIASAFYGPCPEGCEVLHINGELHDNRPENLRYDTHAENMHDIYIQGGKARKLTAEDVQQIRFGLFCGFIQRELAAMYGISRSTISDIKCGRTFQWLSSSQGVLLQT